MYYLQHKFIEKVATFSEMCSDSILPDCKDKNWKLHAKEHCKQFRIKRTIATIRNYLL